ncbi:MAG: hypothetical protein ACJ73D_00780 [Pyrinomonadaceae bacterium]
MIRQFRSLVVIAASLWAFSSLALAGEWTSLKTEHFTIVGSATQSELRKIAARLGLSRAAISVLMPTLKLDAGHRLSVIVFADPAEYRTYKPKRTDGTIDDAVAGYYLHGDGSDFIAVKVDDGLETVSHEYFHYVLRSNVPATSKIPPWIDEGLAQYFESIEAAPDGSVRLGSEPRNRIADLKRHSFSPPNDLFSAEPAALKGTDDQRSLFYAWSWAAVEYLEQLPNAEQKTRELISAVAKGEEAAAIRDGVFGSDNGVLFSRIAAVISRPSLPLKTQPINLPISSEAVATQLSRSASETLLANLLEHLGRASEAEDRLRKILASGDAPARAHAILGSILARGGSYHQAEKELDTAIAMGDADPTTYFFHAFAISKAGSGVTELDETVANAARASLQRAIAQGPELAQAYQLLAILDIERGSNIGEAESMLEKALTLRPNDESLEMLLGRALLLRERYRDASSIAEKLVHSSDAAIRSQANDIIGAAMEYKDVGSLIILRPNVKVPWDQPYVFLKRSWLTEADVAVIDADRDVHNMNALLGPSRENELRVLGSIDQVKCTEGRVFYSATVDGKRQVFTSSNFESVRLSVLLEGSHSYKLDCGVNLSNARTVITYKQPAGGGSIPQLRALAFVPNEFRLQSLQDVVGFRTVVVEDDRLRRLRDSTVEHLPDLGTEPRLAAIATSLGGVPLGQRRVMSTIRHVDCGTNSIALTLDVDGATVRVTSEDPKSVKVRWFTVENTEEPLACGADTAAANVLVSYVPDSGASGGDLKEIDFVPSGSTLDRK